MNWLSTMDTNEQQTSAFAMASPGTGNWLFEAFQFDRWLKGKSKLLWCPGNGESDAIVRYLTHCFCSWCRKNNLGVG
jgi:hypothetical protein